MKKLAAIDESQPICAANGKKPHLCDPTIDYMTTWGAMEKLVAAGKCKSIGVSNFNDFQMNRICKESTIKPAVNQIEVHPYLTNETLIKTCLDQNVQIMAFSPLGNPAKPVTRVWNEDALGSLLEDSRVLDIAKKYNKTAAQVK